MFQLYDRTRRRICLAWFFLFCLAPTALVVAWCLERRLPGYAQAEADRLGRQLGVKVELEKFAHPKPDKAVYEGLRLCDAETGREILKCRRLEATVNRGGQPIAISIGGLAIQLEQWNQAWAAIDRVLRCRAGWSSLDVQFQADEAVLLAGEPRALDQVKARLQILPTQSQVGLIFRVAGVEMPEPAWFGIVRDRKTDPPVTGFVWKTGSAAIPCFLLPPALGLAETLGPQSWISGSGWANRTADGWAGEATGQLSGVDLDRLVSSRFAHRLSGQARIEVKAAKFHQGRIQQFWANAQAGPGTVSRSLLDAAVDRLGLAGPAAPASSESLLSFDRLALEFFIDSRGLQLRGDEYGAILGSQRGRLLAAPANLEQPLPLAAVLQMLAPGTGPQVPASRETEPLLARLPVASPAAPGESKQ
ncbi:MAG: hypothetical protein HUU20_20460 [Pirellulales bacterium]|nr:hypothetical protein [Pirellulales bacterium]